MWTCLKQKVTPILGGLLAYIDTNCNLEILNGELPESWLYKLWMGMLKNTKITPLQYADIGTW